MLHGPADIDKEAQLFAQIYIADGAEAARTALERRSIQGDPRRAFHALVRADATVITTNLPSLPTRRSDEWWLLEADIYRDGDENDYTPLVRDITFLDGSRLLIGRDAEDLEEIEETLASGIPWAGAGVILLALLGGLLMSRALSVRLEAINRAARQVMGGDLSGRVPVRGSGDDFDQLAETLNAMLQRNEELFEAVKRVSDNVAHELRTPLARLQISLERLSEKQLTAEERNRLTIDASLEAQRLGRIFEALLRISRLEGGRYALNLRNVNAVAVAHDVAELYGPTAAQRGINIQVDAPSGLCLTGDADLLAQALANLVDNAVKFSPDQAVISVAVERRERSIVFTVSDCGAGMAEDELSRATERFFRGADAARLRGEGLGLSLAAAIAALHGGTLMLRNMKPGLRATLELPDDVSAAPTTQR